MIKFVLISLFCVLTASDRAAAQPVRGAFPSPSIQILPLMVAAERGFFKREGLELELVFVRGASTAVQALLANQIHFIFSIGPQMPAVWEGNDIMLLARRFCVNVLRRDQVTLSSAFSGALPAEERFGLGQWMTSAEGVTYLADAQINIFCKKAAAVPYGTHTIFIGEAETVNVRDPIEPLIYQDATYCFSVPHDSQAA